MLVEKAAHASTDARAQDDLTLVERGRVERRARRRAVYSRVQDPAPAITLRRARGGDRTHDACAFNAPLYRAELPAQDDHARHQRAAALAQAVRSGSDRGGGARQERRRAVGDPDRGAGGGSRTHEGLPGEEDRHLGDTRLVATTGLEPVASAYEADVVTAPLRRGGPRGSRTLATVLARDSAGPAGQPTSSDGGDAAFLTRRRWYPGQGSNLHLRVSETRALANFATRA
jgi:hypothetical protein